ncbi:centriolar coiled-coil protein of 110 kDa [Megalops cyprinoides]|uniref:centriolar coiled-coil protein of 110 kDa n=1 Tax=Megalops cyprinoides TaxID=118141 RepID=UPI001864F14D|nr:centriolar coiled-coil protein of 110 kDa [Megalops cyprinoides]
MESYEDFIRTRRDQLQQRSREPMAASPWRRGRSAISFHGVPILPPLLTAERIQEMQGHRQEASRRMNRREKPAPDQRMSRLQALLDSVQLRRAPTLQEFIGGDRAAAEWQGGEAGGESCGGGGESPWEPDLPLCDPLTALHCGRGADPFPLLTSTARAPLDCHASDHHADGAWAESPGRAVSAPEFCPAADAHTNTSHQSASSGYATHDNTELTCHTSRALDKDLSAEGDGQTAPEGFFLHHAAHVTRVDDIISKAPPVVDSASQADPGERAAVSGCFVPGVSEPGLPDPEPPEGPYRMSLQNLLKKSQEYRQRQRQVRSARARAREKREAQNLSDKENQLLPHTGAGEVRAARERRPGQGKSLLCTSESFRLDRPRAEGVEPQETLSSPKEKRRETRMPEAVSFPREVPGAGSSDGLTGSSAQAKLTDSPAEPPWAAGPAAGRFGAVPSPQFCTSPVRCVKRDGLSRKLVVNMPLSVGSDTGGRQSAGSESAPLGREAEAQAERSGEQALHLDHLEMNLCSLKALICDLESTLTETHGDGVASEGVSEAARPCRRKASVSQRAVRGAGGPHALSLAQRQRVPGVFRAVGSAGSRQGPVLCDTSNQPAERDPAHSLSLNLSYDVHTPSTLWPQGSASQGKPLTPEVEGQGQDSRAKRRLLMNTVEKRGQRGRAAPGTGAGAPPLSSTPKAQTVVPEELQLEQMQTQTGQIQAVMQDQQLQLEQTQTGQIQAVMQNQQLQMEQLLQQVSFLPPLSSSRLKDAATSLSPGGSPAPPGPALSRPWTPVPAWRPLVAAAVRGYLTRRLLRTERVTQLLRTVKDSRQLLQSLQTQTPGRGEGGSRQDLLLQERVLLQLRSARYELHDVVFCSAAERMQLIRWDRELLREKELKRKENGLAQGRGRGALSAATKKSLERKRSVMIQKRAAERQRSLVGGVCGTQFCQRSDRECRSVVLSRP